jgi:hypothetical protein
MVGLAALCASKCQRARRVRRREELGLVALVLHHTERGIGTWQRGGRAASMVETHECMAATPSAKGAVIE